MDYMRIYKLIEDDFDRIIESAGGKRLSEDDSREKSANVDYILDDAIIELKFVEEEGLEKQERQQKLADISDLIILEARRIYRRPYRLDRSVATTRLSRTRSRKVEHRGGAFASGNRRPMVAQSVDTIDHRFLRRKAAQPASLAPTTEEANRQTASSSSWLCQMPAASRGGPGTKKHRRLLGIQDGL